MVLFYSIMKNDPLQSVTLPFNVENTVKRLVVPSWMLNLNEGVAESISTLEPPTLISILEISTWLYPFSTPSKETIPYPLIWNPMLGA